MPVKRSARLSALAARGAAAAAALVIVALALSPQGAMEGVRQSLELCAQVVVPSLFPFFVAASLAIDLGLARSLGRLLSPVMVPLFGLGGSCALPLVLGLLGGYPVGARSLVELTRSGGCTREEAQRLLMFCNNSGPAFFLGVVGAGIFQSPRAGLLLWGGHGAGAVCVGVISRLLPLPSAQAAPCAPPPASRRRGAAVLTGAATGAVSAMLNVCAFVLLFGGLLGLLEGGQVYQRLSTALSSLLPGLTPECLRRAAAGVLEVSNGVWTLQSGGSLPARLVLASLMLGWGGLSVHLQTLTLLEGSGLRPGPYLAGKALHGLCSAGLTALALFLFPQAVPAWCAAGDVGSSPSTLWAILAACLPLLLLVALPWKNQWKSRR